MLALALAPVLALGQPDLIVDPAPNQDLKWRVDDTSVSLLRGEQTVWTFKHAKTQSKPYFHPLAIPGGPVLTWESPPDHIWHYGLWFSWKYINGVNYWEENANHRAAGLTQWSNVAVTTRPDHTASITMDLVYREPGRSPVLTEERRIDVSAPGPDGTYHIDWTSTFTAGDVPVTLDRTPLLGEEGGQAWGGYAGLSFRFCKDITDREAVGTGGPIEFDEYARSRFKAEAVDFHGAIGPLPVGVAICDHPDNLNAPSPWYVNRADPLTFFTPAVLCFGAHSMDPGEELTLRYRALIHRGRWDQDRLRTEYEKFVQDSQVHTEDQP